MEYSRRIAQQLLPALLLLQTMSCFRLGVSARLLGEANTTDLITSTCRHTDYFDICMSTLQSNPDSRNADVKGLALISLEVCIAHAEGTISYMRQLRGNASTTGRADGDKYETQCLDDCATEYDDALDDLRKSVGKQQSGDYDSVNAMVSGAMTDSDTCEGGFGERPGYTSPLTERNDYFAKLCSNSLAITGLLS
ncbi:hypothetical protein Taro_050954 [Colocasia esculenta]|uniref:Pectinesterase inhibitor domain-containing protein n=1 Tax=Colocasia esculenta TaxID=4460 RepID=A0A843XFF0_COLES|nr:hypothetical protein [Colocasia esculenta]